MRVSWSVMLAAAGVRLWGYAYLLGWATCALGLLASPGWAGSLNYCQDGPEPTAAVQDRLMRWPALSKTNWTARVRAWPLCRVPG